MVSNLRSAEIDRVKFSFSMYESDDKLDSVFLPLVLRGLNFNPSLKQLDALGVKSREGEKMFTFEELLEIYAEYKKNMRNFGTQVDFIEVLKMLDKNGNGKISLAEISGLLATLGEPLNANEMDEIMADCMPEDDDEGDVEFLPFVKALCEAL